MIRYSIFFERFIKYALKAGDVNYSSEPARYGVIFKL